MEPKAPYKIEKGEIEERSMGQEGGASVGKENKTSEYPTQNPQAKVSQPQPQQQLSTQIPGSGAKKGAAEQGAPQASKTADGEMASEKAGRASDKSSVLSDIASIKVNNEMDN